MVEGDGKVIKGDKEKNILYNQVNPLKKLSEIPLSAF